jgi:hypothetical protein
VAVHILNTFQGRNVVFECFDKNGATIDVGRWSKQELNTHRRIRRLRLKEGKEGISDMGSSMGQFLLFHPVNERMLMAVVTDETDEETDELESTTDEEEEADGPQLREITKFLRQLYRKSARCTTN